MTLLGPAVSAAYPRLLSLHPHPASDTLCSSLCIPFHSLIASSRAPGAKISNGLHVCRAVTTGHGCSLTANTQSTVLSWPCEIRGAWLPCCKAMSVCMEYPATSAVSLDAQISYSHPQDHPAHVSGVCASCSNLQVQWI